MSAPEFVNLAQLGGHTVADFAKLSRVSRDQLKVYDNASPFPLEALVDIEREVTRDIYKPTNGLLHCPTKADLQFGTKKVRYVRQKASGKAKFIDMGGDITASGVPSVASASETIEGDVRTLAVKFNLDDETAAAENNSQYDIDLMRDQAAACKLLLDELMDGVVMTGAGLPPGLFGDKLVKKETLASITDGAVSGLSSATSADDLLLALTRMVNRVYENSGGAYSPDRLLLPLDVYNYASDKHLDNGKTVLEQVARNRWLAAGGGIEAIHGVADLQAIPGQPGPIALAYRKNPTDVQVRLMPPRQHKVLQLAFGVCVIWTAKIGPVQWKRPISALQIGL